MEYLNENDIRKEYKRKFARENFVDDYTSLYVFQEERPIQKLIHELKYNQKFKIGIFLGNELANSKKEKIISWRLDLMIPVPLHKLKRIERNYNQALYISKGIKDIINTPIYNSILSRKKYTKSQTKLSLEEREANLRGAFVLKKKIKLRSRNVLLVDDVITTGATVKEIAKILKENGANKVFAISIATPPFSHSLRSTHP